MPTQINLFNATLQLNRNVTVTGSSFVTGSFITSVGENTSSLIPYVAGGDNHPYVTFEETLFTGVCLSAKFVAFIAFTTYTVLSAYTVVLTDLHFGQSR